MAPEQQSTPSHWIDQGVMIVMTVIYHLEPFPYFTVQHNFETNNTHWLGHPFPPSQTFTQHAHG